MMLQFDVRVAQERYYAMLRMAEQERLAARIAHREEETLLSRMAKLFASSLRRLMHRPQQNTSTPQTLAAARSR